MSSDDTRRVYITKYALTKGILVLEVRRDFNGTWDAGHYCYTRRNQQFKLGSNAFFTEDEALVAAEEMRQKKLVSLTKQVEKIRNLEIKVEQ